MEALIAVAILGAIGVTYITSLAAANNAVQVMDEQQQAEMLVRAQLEDIKSASYLESGDYPITVALPHQYTMDIVTTAPTQIGTLDDNTTLEEIVGGPVDTIQEITVQVYHFGNHVLSIACYKVKR